jgi:N-acetylglucosaminyldiphosphoundecaprenol N-acetyl-beta-D-mannosaminyltransferase
MKPMASDPLRAGEKVDKTTDSIPYVRILGVKIHSVDMATTLDAVRNYIHDDQPRFVVTADSYGIVLAQTDDEFRKIVNGADLVTPDSSGILVGAKMLGAPLRERVSGVDIAREMCGMSAEEGFSIFFLGAAPGVAERAAENLARRYTGMRVAGTRDGYFSALEEPEVVDSVRKSGAKVLLVAMGIPRQEKFIRHHLREFGVSVAMGVGGSFDVFSGKVRRAPEWMQRHGLEWAYRLVKNPRKIRKVAALPQFIGLVWREKYFPTKEGSHRQL